MSSRSQNALGAVYMAIGSAGYVVNDAAIRRVTEEGPGVYQALFLRSLLLVAFFAAAGAGRGDPPRRSQLRRPLVVRVGAEAVAAALFFAAIVRMEFANAQAILQVVPFAVTAAAATVLHERVSARQYLAVAAGFFGVLVVIRPATGSFSIWSLAVLGAAAVLVVREFATREIDDDTPAGSVALATAIGLAALTGALSVTEDWMRPNATAIGFLALATASLVVGYVFTIQTVRVGDLSVSAPFRYTTIVGAVVIGIALFDENPDAPMIVGSLIIIASGAYAFALERGASATTGATAGVDDADGPS